MESNAHANAVSGRIAQGADKSEWFTRRAQIKWILAPLASLRLTVVLLAMGIFIVLAGTMAQVEKGIWQVTDEYFRTAVAWIDLQVFFPRHWFPHLPDVPGRFPFPGGWLIGFVLAINLLAAHWLRFGVQARGRRLVAGVAMIAVGTLVTWLVIASAANKTELGEIAPIEWSTLWLIIEGAIGVSWLAAAYFLIVLDHGRKMERLLLLAAVLGLGGLLGWLFRHGEHAPMNDSSLRILWQLAKGGFAALILLAGCALLFKKRAGVVLVHAGVALLMLGELLVGVQAVEGRMRIQEGQTTNYVEETRHWELAIIEPSATDRDRVVVVPGSVLRRGETIRETQLPFEVSVVRFFTNSTMRNATAGDVNPATAGTGLRWIAEEKPPVSGTGGEVDRPSAYVKLTEKDGGRSLGTYLVSLRQSYEGGAERVQVGPHSYDVSLRYKRTYKPYSIRLIDFRFDKYFGTTRAKNFSSDVQLVDPSRGVDRNVRIWMNNPLRYAGETFYQSGYATDPTTGAEVTVLQVVSNWGWMIPYVSCMLVATGLLAHLSGVLLRFLRRQSQPEVARETTRPRVRGPVTRGVASAFPLSILAGAVLVLGFAARPPETSNRQMRLDEFGKLPLLYEGRVKPFDTLARNSLSIISQKQTFKDASGTTQPAIRWLLDWITQSEDAGEHKVVRIENLDLLHVLGLERRRGFRYSVRELRDNMAEFQKQVALAHGRDKDELTIFQRKLVELDNRIRHLGMLEQAFRPARIRTGHEAVDLPAARRRVERLPAYQPPLAVPREETASPPWESFASASVVAYGKQLAGQPINPATASLASIFQAYRERDTEAFNREVDKYGGALRTDPPALYNASKTRFEAFFNRSQPFFWAAFLYVLAFVLAALAWLGWSVPLNRAASWLIFLTFLVHTAALLSRMYISGRPPVTNLYSSAVFIGWGGVILGLVLEAVYRMGIGNIVAAVSGFATLLVAHFLSRSGDTFVVLQAVLDTQFWLATHVTAITLGYSTTFVAGGLGILYILRGFCTPSLTAQVGKDLSRMIYGTICFAIFFSFVGTVLGGLWADDSWGRFWGWDPKENGALIIVLWNALILHARWGGMVRDRGLAVLAVCGNICTAWSWFGTNELGVGLHSYGFTEGVLLALGIFCATQLAVIAVGLVPLHMWWSFRHQQKLSLQAKTS